MTISAYGRARGNSDVTVSPPRDGFGQTGFPLKSHHRIYYIRNTFATFVGSYKSDARTCESITSTRIDALLRFDCFALFPCALLSSGKPSRPAQCASCQHVFRGNGQMRNVRHALRIVKSSCWPARPRPTDVRACPRRKRSVDGGRGGVCETSRFQFSTTKRGNTRFSTGPRLSYGGILQRASTAFHAIFLLSARTTFPRVRYANTKGSTTGVHALPANTKETRPPPTPTGHDDNNT